MKGISIYKAIAKAYSQFIYSMNYKCHPLIVKAQKLRNTGQDFILSIANWLNLSILFFWNIKQQRDTYHKKAHTIISLSLSHCLPPSWDSMVMMPSRSGPKPCVVWAWTLNLYGMFSFRSDTVKEVAALPFTWKERRSPARTPKIESFKEHGLFLIIAVVTDVDIYVDSKFRYVKCQKENKEGGVWPPLCSCSQVTT